MNICKHHRFPLGTISYATWLCYRFIPGHRDIKGLLAERGIIVTRESIRRSPEKSRTRKWRNLRAIFGLDKAVSSRGTCRRAGCLIISLKKLLFLVGMSLLVSPRTWAQQIIPIWGETEPPFHKAHQLTEYEGECWDVVCAYQVVRPTLTLYLPKGGSSHTAVIILPGGGYENEAVHHEGFEIAEALSQSGIVAAVLKYRLPNPQTSTQPQWVPASDVRQALYLLRRQQKQLGFEADRFGVLGFSAGGHLAAQVSVHPDGDANRNPDFSMLVYGVSRLNEENRHWLEKTLYHRAMTEEEVAYQTLLKHVDSNTPPAFLVHALDDEICHYSESTLYSEALTHNGVDNELHLFAHGGHGFGGGRASDGTGQWLDLATNWLKRLP